MTREDETEPVDGDALDRIRAEAVKQQQDHVPDAAENVGKRRRPRKRTQAPNDLAPSHVMPTAQSSPPLLPEADDQPRQVWVQPSTPIVAKNVVVENIGDDQSVSIEAHEASDEPISGPALDQPGFEAEIESGTDARRPASTRASEIVQEDANRESTMQPAEPEFWKPGTRLAGRVNTDSGADFASTSPDRGRMLAAAILVVALLIAVGLYVLGSVLVNDDDSPIGVDGTEQPE